MEKLKGLYLNKRFYFGLSAIVVLFCIGFMWQPMFVFAQILLLVFVLLFVGDFVWLFNKNIRIKTTRTLPKLLSLGDENRVRLQVHNLSPVGFGAHVIDELPHQLQKRTFGEQLQLLPAKRHEIVYTVRPVVRGKYNFGHTIVFLSSVLGLVSRRINTAEPQTVAVYPSIIQMKKFQLAANPRLQQFLGVKKMRRIGHSYEFEQIKNYVQGDDYRSLNWKATGRHGDLMVNQFQDERSQPVYCLIDKSRQMRLPFEGMSLLDYAINTSLVISNVALQKRDRAGLITFADGIDTVIKADNRMTQLRSILEALYTADESMQEANFELLYKVLKNVVRTRSLIILFTNIESRQTLERIKPILKRISSFHLLLVIFFENTELTDYYSQPVESITDTYLRGAAMRTNDEKRFLIQDLQHNGIYTALSRPEDLTITALNKYLEFKARGLI